PLYSSATGASGAHSRAAARRLPSGKTETALPTMILPEAEAVIDAQLVAVGIAQIGAELAAGLRLGFGRPFAGPAIGEAGGMPGAHLLVAFGGEQHRAAIGMGRRIAVARRPDDEGLPAGQLVHHDRIVVRRVGGLDPECGEGGV